jgi:hypothetical protein
MDETADETSAKTQLTAGSVHLEKFLPVSVQA